MTALEIIGGFAILVGVLVWIAMRLGRVAASADADKKLAEIKDAQLKVDRPDRDAVRRSLRDHGF